MKEVVNLKVDKENAIYIIQMELNKLRDITDVKSINICLNDISNKLNDILSNEYIKNEFSKEVIDIKDKNILKAKGNAIKFLEVLIYKINDTEINNIRSIDKETAANIRRDILGE